MKDFILDYTHAYIHACERAELLGLPIPSEEEWKETQAETNSHVNDNDDDEVIQNVCGSLSTLLKVKVGSRNNTPDHKHIEQKDNEIKNVHAETSMDEENLTVELGNNKMDKTETNTTVPKKIDINEKMGSHLDKLDSLITKAENAQYSMQHQTKQMKKFLK
ncbi:uncharacterized protein LOC100880813 isoform X2 [Megachile rotundata]|uniref:uncharacterized protein LOC100880813 isoform X2 n=1 Tax=Megachile rotundata TaxID=143995 RepID=UPI003FD1B53C